MQHYGNNIVNRGGGFWFAQFSEDGQHFRNWKIYYTTADDVSCGNHVLTDLK